jgi:hypothetical protein
VLKLLPFEAMLEHTKLRRYFVDAVDGVRYGGGTGSASETLDDDTHRDFAGVAKGFHTMHHSPNFMNSRAIRIVILHTYSHTHI